MTIGTCILINLSMNLVQLLKKYILPVNSCTAAIHLSLLVLDVSKGDEIIVPDITWVASASPILYCGAKPVFCDIDKKIGVLILGLLKSQLQKNKSCYRC